MPIDVVSNNWKQDISQGSIATHSRCGGNGIFSDNVFIPYLFSVPQNRPRLPACDLVLNQCSEDEDGLCAQATFTWSYDLSHNRQEFSVFHFVQIYCNLNRTTNNEQTVLRRRCCCSNDSHLLLHSTELCRFIICTVLYRTRFVIDLRRPCPDLCSELLKPMHPSAVLDAVCKNRQKSPE